MAMGSTIARLLLRASWRGKLWHIDDRLQHVVLEA